MIARRHVFHIAGYDPVGVDAMHRRFCRELAAFARLWGIAASAGEIEQRDGHPCWSVSARGESWAVTSVYEPLDWHDLVRPDIDRPLAGLLRDGLTAGFDFAASGTLGRYFKSSVSYALFFLSPYLALALFSAISIGTGILTFLVLDASLPGALLALPVAGAAFALLMRTVGKWWRVRQCLAIWIFSRAYLQGKRPDIEERIEAFAARVAARAGAGGVDEIVCVGHSIGTILLVEVMARVLDRDPDIGGRVKLALLTVGSNLPMLYLHPAGVGMHARGERVAAQSAIDWAEYQSRGDGINFYRFHPIALKPTGAATDAIKPHVRGIGMREMMAPGSRWRRAMRHMRRHYQFVMANEQLARYDYFMFICGPVPAADLVRAQGGPLDFLAVGGVLREAEPLPQ